MNRTAFITVVVALCASHAGQPSAEPVYALVFKNHHIVPAELHVPAGKKITLHIDNQDATPEEFESYALNREKIIAANSQVTVFIGPLKPGSYAVFGEFNAGTAQGKIIAE